ncbi:2-succinyl-6-hydroxy-2,4-cyclohexadiene-1-carboxylate synthase [Phormidesmis priestleyi]
MFQFNFTLQGSTTLPVILFLHGFLGSGEDFAGIVPQFDRFCCLCIDLPGHGKTQVVGDYSLASTAHAIVALLDRLNIPKTVLVGYSLGGRLALLLALQFPDRFPQTILESASPGLKTEAERAIRREQDDKLSDRLTSDFPKFLSEWYDQPLFRSLKQHPNFAAMYQHRLENNPVELAKSLRNLSTGRQSSLWSTLERYEQPLLLMVGERDRKFVSINQEMAARCQTAQLKILVNTGHNLHLEDPQAFTMHINQFLRSIP